MVFEEQSQPQLKDSVESKIVKTPKQEHQEPILTYPNVPNNGSPDQDHNLTPTKVVKEEANNEDLADEEFFNHLPPGYRFNPTDVELIIYYLKPETENKRLPRNQIRRVNLYQYTPCEITAKYKGLTEREWYFFTPRERKYRNGNRPNRAAGTGYWKATGADKSIIHNADIIGFRKALDFYEGKPPRGEKTSWIMHEYRVKEVTPKKKRNETDMRLDDYILCRIYEKGEKPLKTQLRGEVRNRNLQHDDEVLSWKEQNVGSSISKNEEFVNSDGESSHVMDASVPLSENFHSQQSPPPPSLPLNKRLRPISFPLPTNFAPPLHVNPAENLPEDDNIWSLPAGIKAPQLSELDLPYDVGGLAELDNMLFTMYAPIDDLPLENPSMPKKI